VGSLRDKLAESGPRQKIAICDTLCCDQDWQLTERFPSVQFEPLDFGEDLMPGLDCFNLMGVRYSAQLPRIVVITAISIAHYSQVTASDAATVTIDENLTIDASNSFPDTGSLAEVLLVDIIEGASGSPTVEVVEGGSIGGFAYVRDASHLIVSGGEIDGLTRVFDNATLTLSGGSIAPRAVWYQAADPSGVIRIEDSGTVNLRGGEFFGKISQADDSVVNIYGRNFIVNGELPNGTTTHSGVRVRGEYADGTHFDIPVGRDSTSAQVFLFTVPEPNCVCLVALATSVALKRRRIKVRDERRKVKFSTG
jgi:hypothetical protein